MEPFLFSDCASLRKTKTDQVNESLSHIRSDCYRWGKKNSHYKPTNLSRFLKVLANDTINVISSMKNSLILIPQHTDTHRYSHTHIHTALNQHPRLHSHRALFILPSYQGLQSCLPNIFKISGSQKMHNSLLNGTK